MEAAGRSTAFDSMRRLVSGHGVLPASKLAPVVSGLPTGMSVLDGFLPHGGFARGGINECYGNGVHTLAGWPLAYHSRYGRVMYVGLNAYLNPAWIESLGGNTGNYLVAREGRVERFVWLVEQVIGSGLFGLVVVGCSHFETGEPLFAGDDVIWRRWFGASRRHGTTVLLLLRPHERLVESVRPCGLRLRVDWAGADKGGVSALVVHVTRCAGAAPGSCIHIPIERLGPVASGDGGARGWA